MRENIYIYCCFEKYSALLSGLMVELLVSGFQSAGQTSPCLSVNWKAWISLIASSTERPTGKSLTVIWRRTPFGSIKNEPRRVTPSSVKTPYSLETLCALSESNGSLRSGPRPPSLRGTLAHARWVNSESVEAPKTSTPSSRNFGRASINWRI